MKTIKQIILFSTTLCILFSLDGKTTHKIYYANCAGRYCTMLKTTPKAADTIKLSLPQIPTSSDWKFSNVTGLTSPYRYAPTKSEGSTYTNPVAYFDVKDGSDTAGFTVQQRDSTTDAVLEEKTFTFKIKPSKK